jgi:hypothetical protein
LTPEDKETVLAGGDAEDWSSTLWGQRVIALANADADAAVLAFAEVDVTDQRKVANIQQDLRVAMKLEQYLQEIIVKGRETYQASQKEE